MPKLPSLIRPRPSKDLLAAPISAFESETHAVILRTSPYSEHAILHVLAVFMIVVVVLMSVVKLDRVVVAAGKITPTQGMLFVQPFDKAIVRQILVHTGDIVKKGQVLAELDPTFAQADLKQLQDHVAVLSAMAARLTAELAGTPYQGGDTSAEQLQESIWHQRQTELQQTLADFDARIRSDESAVTKSQQDLQAYNQRLNYAIQYTGMQETLEKDGNTSKVKVLGAHDAQAEVARQVSETRNTLAAAQHDLEALRAQRSVAVGKWHDDIGTQLSSTRDELHQNQQSLAKASRISDLSSLTAPQDSVVLDIGSASVNSVVDSSTSMKPLFTLVPLDGPVEGELRIPGGEVGFVKVNDKVQVKLDAYPFMRHGTAKGVITTISDGAFSEDESGQRQGAYFKARVRLTDLSLHNVPQDFRLIPGMGLQGDVLVGHRTIMSYLLSGALRTGSEAMREP